MFLAFSFAKATEGLRKATDLLLEDPIEEVERRAMIASGLPNRTGDQIRRLIKEDSRPDQPHK